MYGTIASMRARPGRRGDLIEAVGRGRDYRGNYVALSHGLVSGWISTVVYELDSHPDQAIMLAVFDSRQSYRENAESREQRARYETYRAVLEADPEWHDGDITPFFAMTDWHTRSQLYGTVVRFSLKPGADSVCEEYFSHWRDERTLEVIPGAVGTWLLRPDDEPAIAYAAVLFESKRTYVDNAASPAQDRQYRALREWLTQDPDWFDGRVTVYHRF